MDDSKIITKATEVVTKCRLPSLQINVGEEFLPPESFDEFKHVLKENLTLLFDLFHQHQFALLSTESETLEFRTEFVLVLCEQNAPNAPFKVEDESLLKVLASLKEKFLLEILQKDRKIIDRIFSQFREQLKKDAWRKNFGSIHSFIEFCRIFSTHESLDYDKSAFLLAVGHQFIDNFEPFVKILGVQLFHILLSDQNVALIREFNMHEVIYKALFDLILKARKLDLLTELWTCLYVYIRLEEGPREDFSKWSRFDDVFEALLNRMIFENEAENSRFYLGMLLKFAILDERELERIEAASIEELRKEVEPNFRVYRWSKKILQVLVNESFKLGGESKRVLSYLKALHVVYLVCIYGMNVNLIERQLIDFLKSFSQTLKEVIRSFSADVEVKSSIDAFLTTFRMHFDRKDDKTASDVKILLDYELI